MGVGNGGGGGTRNQKYRKIENAISWRIKPLVPGYFKKDSSRIPIRKNPRTIGVIHASVVNYEECMFWGRINVISNNLMQSFFGHSFQFLRWFLPIFACRGGPGSAAPRGGGPRGTQKLIRKCFCSPEPFTKIFWKRKPRENLTKTS